MPFNYLFETYTKSISKNYRLVSLLSYMAVLAFFMFELFILRDDQFHHHFDWKVTQYSANYIDFGFIKRGLIGTLLYPLSSNQIIYGSLAFGAISFLSFVYTAPVLLNKLGLDEFSKNLLLTLLAVSPFSAFQMGFIPNNTDPYNQVILVLNILLIYKGRTTGVLLLNLVGLLIHEGFIVYGTLLTGAFYIYYRKLNLLELLKSKFIWLLGSTSLILVLLLSTKGNNTQINLVNVVGNGVNVWARGAIEYKVSGGISGSLVWVILGLLHTNMFYLYKCNKGKFDILYVAFLAQMSLFWMGWDYPRWLSFMFFTFILIFMIKSKTNNWTLNHLKIKLSLILFIIPLGPIGVTNVYPLIRDCFKYGLIALGLYKG